MRSKYDTSSASSSLLPLPHLLTYSHSPLPPSPCGSCPCFSLLTPSFLHSITAMEAESRDAFTLLFNQQFAANLAKVNHSLTHSHSMLLPGSFTTSLTHSLTQGLHKSQAAAEALTATQRLLAVRQSPTAVSQPLPHSNTHSATSTTNSDTGTSIPTAIHPPPIKVSPAVTPPLPPVSKVEPVVKAKPLPLPLPVKIREPVRVSSSILQALVEECQKTSSYTPVRTR